MTKFIPSHINQTPTQWQHCEIAIDINFWNHRNRTTYVEQQDGSYAWLCDNIIKSSCTNITIFVCNSNRTKCHPFRYVASALALNEVYSSFSLAVWYRVVPPILNLHLCNMSNARKASLTTTYTQTSQWEVYLLRSLTLQHLMISFCFPLFDLYTLMFIFKIKQAPSHYLNQ